MLTNLTGIRGIAALWVFLFHYQEYFHDVVGNQTPFDAIINRGAYGVDLFFSLSGFIMGYVYFDRFMNSKEDKIFVIQDFFIKRVARLYPVYLCTTILALLIFTLAKISGHKFVHVSSDLLTLSNVLKNILLIQIWDSSPSLNYPSWSVSAEFLAYLAFPIIIIIFFKWLRNVKFAALFLLSSSLFFYEISPYTYFSINGPITKVLTEFMMGLSAYLLIRCVELKKMQVLVLRFILITILCIFLYAAKSEALTRAILPLILLAIVCANYFQNVPTKGLSRKSFVKLGTWSYSLYLTHGLFHYLLGGLGLPIVTSNLFINCLQLSVIGICVVVIAKFMTDFIEKPGRKYILRVLSR